MLDALDRRKSARVLWLEMHTPPRTLREMRLVAATLPRPRHPWRIKPTPFAKLRRSDAVISDKTCCTIRGLADRTHAPARHAPLFELSFGDRSLFRYILLPGVIVIACAMGGFGFLLWSLFNIQFNSNWRPDQAYSGNIAAQRHLATCYTTGCARVPQDIAFACAWRKIISNEDKQASDTVAARDMCSHLSASDQKWITSLEADIRSRMREDRERGIPQVDTKFSHETL